MLSIHFTVGSMNSNLVCREELCEWEKLFVAWCAKPDLLAEPCHDIPESRKRASYFCFSKIKCGYQGRHNNELGLYF